MKLLSAFHRLAKTPKQSDPSCFQKLTEFDTLYEAWRHVKKNKGAAGVDGVTVKKFEPDMKTNLAHLSTSLQSGTYRPAPLRRVTIPKKQGGVRELAIPTIQDRIIQTAVYLLYSPSFEQRFHENSWGYRPKRSYLDAIEVVEALIDAHSWVVDADIENFFDEVPHLRLIEDLSIWIQDEKVLQLILLWLNGFSNLKKGLAQGSPISPLLSNIYLHPLDRLMWSFGYTHIRYADDFIVICQNKFESEKALVIIKAILSSRQLKLNEDKTKLIRPSEPFDFLGRTFNIEGYYVKK